MQSENTFAKRLRRLRTDRDMTIRDVARAADLAESTVYRFEADITALPRSDTLERLALALHVTTDKLLGLNHRPPVPGAVPLSDVQLVQLPLVRKLSTAGDSLYDSGDVLEVVDVPRAWIPAGVDIEDCFVWQVSRDMLAGAIRAGDCVLVERTPDPRDSIPVAIIRAADRKSLEVRRVFIEGQVVWASSDDPTEPPSRITDRQVVASVLGYWHAFRHDRDQLE